VEEENGNAEVEGESVLESLSAEFTVIDLNWSPEEEPDWIPEDEEETEDAEAEDEEESEDAEDDDEAAEDAEVEEESELEDEREQMDPTQLLLHTLATMSMSAIEDLDHDEPYEKVQWDEDLAERYLCIIPTQIHPIAAGSGMYLRFWGYLCEFDPETESVSGRRVTMSLPSKLTRWMGADPETFSMKVYPVDDAVVFMIITQYYGREEFEIDGQKRSAHKFGAIDLIEGRWSED
jgi:hypothetical protein